MITIKNYVKASSLEEAYELNQSRRNCILGGMMWLRTGNRSIDTAVDLCNLNLCGIEESNDCFMIGAMTTLRQLEKDESLNKYFNFAPQKAVKNIVGVQFRNLATVGGSIWGRFGFSDILTVFLSMDTFVELYKGGIIPLSEFINKPKDNDILVRVIVKKRPGKYSYESVRIQSTDFPVITCAVSMYDGKYSCTVGARPAKAVRITDERDILNDGLDPVSIERFSEYVSENISTGKNIRAGKEYRSHLVKVLTSRCLSEIGELS